MLIASRIIVIDDNPSDLDSLTKSLHLNGVSCLPIHFDEDSDSIKPCPNVRILFADLHLLPGPSSYQDHFSTLGGLLEETIKPEGPYLILLWTDYPDEARQLNQHLQERLENVTKPFAVHALEKSKFLDSDRNVTQPDNLFRKIQEITAQHPQLGALFDWENRILSATGNAVSAILELAITGGTDNPSAQLGQTLATLGIAAVGKDNIANDPFRAINEAMFPILSDRVANLTSETEDDGLWRNIIPADNQQKPTPSQVDKDKLNTMFHIAPLNSVAQYERGAVVKLPKGLRENFLEEFNLTEDEAANKQFRCKDFKSDDDSFHWVLIQAQAACDYAQQQPGSLPCYLGLDLPKEKRKSKTAPDALWESPSFELRGDRRCLHINARFTVSLSRNKFNNLTPRYRLREQVLGQLTYHLYNYSGRPGIISFR